MRCCHWVEVFWWGVVTGWRYFDEVLSLGGGILMRCCHWIGVFWWGVVTGWSYFDEVLSLEGVAVKSYSWVSFSQTLISQSTLLTLLQLYTIFGLSECNRLKLRTWFGHISYFSWHFYFSNSKYLCLKVHFMGPENWLWDISSLRWTFNLRCILVKCVTGWMHSEEVLSLAGGILKRWWLQVFWRGGVTGWRYSEEVVSLAGDTLKRWCHWLGVFWRGSVTGWGYSEEVVSLAGDTLKRRCHWLGVSWRGSVTGWGYSEEVVSLAGGILKR